MSYPAATTTPTALVTSKDKSLKEIWAEMQSTEFFNKVKDKNNIKVNAAVCEYKEFAAAADHQLCFTREIF